MTTTAQDDAHTIAEQLISACRRAGLTATAVAPTRVRVHAPGAGTRLDETIKIMPDEDERLCFWWSWGDAIGPVSDLGLAVERIRHVVSEPAGS